MSREQRLRVIEVAKTWVGTPYVSNGMIKGRRGGVDCAKLLLAVYSEAGIIPAFEVPPYSPQWHLHKNVEEYLGYVKQYAHEITEDKLDAGDIVLFKIGRLFAHGAIVETWPRAFHIRAPRTVFCDDIMRDTLGRHALARCEKRFFSYW